MKYFSLLSLSLALFSCDSYQASKSHINPPQVIETITLLGDTLTSPELKESKSFDQFKSAQLNYFDNQDSPEALIWYGRRIAYLGYFKEAIKVFTLGIETYPNDARFYRHRGHRYISTRQYDKAINDFEKAVILIDQTIDQIEPDGLPNSKNIPLSTLHGNIWYHLGLTYYLKNDMNNALKAFTNRSVTHKYDDNIVSGGHWLYMIYRRLNKIEESKAVVDQVNQEMNIIENMSYHQSCLFYKGLLEESELVIDEVALYSLANWYIYEKNDTLKAKEYYQELLKGNPFSFAYIAGEADWVRLYE
ncbi:MAG: tetratricopeptide repeat protein [Cryomorphaceae bacterium]|jgi:tetratricopeptide (TPR) repeat protein|nr:tetratricopeptide repeat protein [Cryomorphaceae bacterium]MBT7546310.1 tetratricopeptide repeat protein [Cryomorphaceae bacterium]